ncbi:biotin--[acetyl-CoA-carboxylase] ligase [Oceanobacillus chungangensis]|uniref:Bifunctional ligase/repressor BirA n=1 Tax=Oceanobacillus chungangensis TaxID=1229152 RepID=A0A3D8Q404_9BACI|nr:biotin--[acetyl-CoA-carboxylase] ligase [Oceanobacillus chungangensis]RDW22065.1 biotin--[acetyl-CoA-carboxylase] ligase [Oceanobacillus chungangensis]
MESTRNKLIQLLADSSEKYISGQLLSDELQISRSAIWKHMKELEKDGYQIEGKSNKGYRIISYPDKLSENTIRWGLETNWIGKSIIHKESTTSTQHIAHDEARNGAAHGTIIIADEQTNGKGRMNRSWFSTKGKGMWLSIILRPKISPLQAPQLTLLTATVLADVLHSYCNVQPLIKWPNDILLHDKKIVGILTEMQAEQDIINYIVIGIGLNVNQSKDDLPEEISHRATSLLIETEKEHSIKALIQEILTTFEKSYDQYIKNGFPEIKQKWESYGFKIGEEITIKTLKDHFRAIFLGIEEDGALRIKRMDGSIEKLYSAEIDWFEK